MELGCLGMVLHTWMNRSEIHHCYLNLLLRPIVMFLAIFTVVFWVLSQCYYQLGRRSPNGIELVNKAEKEGFQGHRKMTITRQDSLTEYDP